MNSKILRTININEYLKDSKVLIVYGPRQVGKTTIIKDFLESYKGKYKSYTGDSITIQEVFSSQRLEKLKEYVEDLDLLFIDEAQNIKNIGINLKMIVDNFSNIKVIVTGSSSFELAGQIGEPLMGRNIILNLYPISDGELRKSVYFEPSTYMDYALRFGSYPEVITEQTVENKVLKVKSLMESFLLKDILKFENLKKPDILLSLLKLLAYQIGNEVNINELAKELKVNYRTIDRYIEILEQAFVIYRLRSYSNNLRNEIKKKSKIYFYDLGIRNAIIDDFSDTNIIKGNLYRKDLGSMFENYLIMERLKNNSYNKRYLQTFFWRNTAGKEVDYIEKVNNDFSVYEFTLNNKTKKKYPKILEDSLFANKFSFDIITLDNYREFI